MSRERLSRKRYLLYIKLGKENEWLVTKVNKIGEGIHLFKEKTKEINVNDGVGMIIANTSSAHCYFVYHMDCDYYELISKNGKIVKKRKKWGGK